MDSPIHKFWVTLYFPGTKTCVRQEIRVWSYFHAVGSGLMTAWQLPEGCLEGHCRQVANIIFYVFAQNPKYIYKKKNKNYGLLRLHEDAHSLKIHHNFWTKFGNSDHNEASNLTTHQNAKRKKMLLYRTVQQQFGPDRLVPTDLCGAIKEFWNLKQLCL